MLTRLDLRGVLGGRHQRQRDHDRFSGRAAVVAVRRARRLCHRREMAGNAADSGRSNGRLAPIPRERSVAAGRDQHEPWVCRWWSRTTGSARIMLLGRDSGLPIVADNRRRPRRIRPLKSPAKRIRTRRGSEMTLRLPPARRSAAANRLTKSLATVAGVGRWPSPLPAWPLWRSRSATGPGRSAPSTDRCLTRGLSSC